LYIKNVKLVLRHVHVIKEVREAINRTLFKKDVIYPIIQPHMVTYIIGTGNNSWEEDRIFNGKIPNRLFFGFVSNSAYNGDSTKNPFNFETLDVKSVTVTVDTQEVSPTLRLDYDDYAPAYNRFLSTLNNEPSLISFDSFKEGSTIYGFDLTRKGNCATHQYLLRREGNLRINVTFGTALPEVKNVVILGEFDRVLGIDAHKNVKKDW